MTARRLGLSLIFIAGLLTACQAGGSDTPVERYTVEIINTYPHDTQAFTQGLIFSDGVIFESTGRRGQSSVRRAALETGEVLLRRGLPSSFFGEGLTRFQDRIYSLTWKAEKGFIFDPDTLERLGEFSYEGEGWGLTANGEHLIVSDGSAKLRFLDPVSFDIDRTLTVRLGGKPADKLNELEWIDGQILANVWETENIYRIDPGSGAVTAIIDASALVDAVTVFNPEGDVLNGIAWDAEGERLFLTGKNWPSLFEVELVAQTPEPTDSP